MNLESALQDWTRRQAFFCYIDASNWSITILCPWCANAALALGGNQVLEIPEIKSCHSRHLTTSRTCQHCALTVSMRAWPRANGDLKASEAVSTNDDVHCFLCIVSFSGSMPFTCEVVLVFFYHRSLTCCIFLSFCTALLKSLCYFWFVIVVVVAAIAFTFSYESCKQQLVLWTNVPPTAGGGSVARIFLSSTPLWDSWLFTTGQQSLWQARTTHGSMPSHLAEVLQGHLETNVMFKRQVSKIVKSFKTSPWPASSCPQCRRLEAIQHRSWQIDKAVNRTQRESFAETNALSIRGNAMARKFQRKKRQPTLSLSLRNQKRQTSLL